MCIKLPLKLNDDLKKSFQGGCNILVGKITALGAFVPEPTNDLNNIKQGIQNVYDKAIDDVKANPGNYGLGNEPVVVSTSVTMQHYNSTGGWYASTININPNRAKQITLNNLPFPIVARSNCAVNGFTINVTDPTKNCIVGTNSTYYYQGDKGYTTNINILSYVMS